MKRKSIVQQNLQAFKVIALKNDGSKSSFTPQNITFAYKRQIQQIILFYKQKKEDKQSHEFSLKSKPNSGLSHLSNIRDKKLHDRKREKKSPTFIFHTGASSTHALPHGHLKTNWVPLVTP